MPSDRKSGKIEKTYLLYARITFEWKYESTKMNV